MIFLHEVILTDMAHSSASFDSHCQLGGFYLPFPIISIIDAFYFQLFAMQKFSIIYFQTTKLLTES